MNRIAAIRGQYHPRPSRVAELAECNATNHRESDGHFAESNDSAPLQGWGMCDGHSTENTDSTTLQGLVGMSVDTYPHKCRPVRGIVQRTTVCSVSAGRDELEVCT